jgi:hypothetical protein
MTGRWYAALAILALTSIGFFVFPGHTILQSDTQIYIPILEHISDPTVLAKDEMAIRPHVSFTLYDESALLLHAATGLSFEHVLMGQQFVYRGVATAGIYLLVTAAGLSPMFALVAAALASLGAAIIGPAVLTVEYEPVPRGFALPFVVFALAMIAHERWTLAAAAGTIAFGFHPPTALAFCALLLLLLLWQRRFTAAGVLALGPLLLLLTLVLQPSSPDKLPLFGQLDPTLEALQRMRAAYNWVSSWAAAWLPLYAILSAVGFLAWWRVRGDLARETNIILVGLPVIGLLSIPLSYVLLEQNKLVVGAQFQPGRYLLFVTYFTIVLSSIAAIRAAQQRSYVESALFFFVPLATAATEWDTARLGGLRLAVVIGLDFVLTLACARTSYQSQRPLSREGAVVICLVAFLPFIALRSAAGVQNYAPLHGQELNALAEWALTSTDKDAVFQFGDAGRRLEPGVFRARAKRALYCDWKSGGQVNFLRDFAILWHERWKLVATQQPLDVYRKLNIDYVVLRTAHAQSGLTPVYQNSEWLVYDVRNLSTSARKGIDAWAPMRVTEIAAAALANRSACSIACPSASATASAALNVSPAAVVSFASTAKPGVWISVKPSA